MDMVSASLSFEWSSAILIPDEYRRKAEECVRLAAKATDPGVQSAYEDAALAYRHLAAEVERWNERMHGASKEER
jgi:hypothetical protein